jgi:hypothetical protein
VAQFQVLSIRGRKTTKDAFTSAGLRAEESVPDNPTVNSSTSQFSSQFQTALLSTVALPNSAVSSHSPTVNSSTSQFSSQFPQPYCQQFHFPIQQPVPTALLSTVPLPNSAVSSHSTTVNSSPSQFSSQFRTALLSTVPLPNSAASKHSSTVTVLTPHCCRRHTNVSERSAASSVPCTYVACDVAVCVSFCMHM